MAHEHTADDNVLVRDAAARIFDRITSPDLGLSVSERAQAIARRDRLSVPKPTTEATLPPDVYLLHKPRVPVAAAQGVVSQPVVLTEQENVWTRLKRRISPARQRQIKTALRWSGYGLAGWFAIVTVMIVAYRFINPPFSNLMLYNHLTGRPVVHTWVPLRDISPAVIRAVVTAEDAQFCRHWGIDFAAIKYAIEHANGGTPRGASTISMQTAKNMFLWQSKSYVRKALEVPVTLMMELVWPKTRMLEVYLNIAEWGPGIFGIGAAARHHFNTTPINLGQAAAAQLAAALPNPKVRRAGRPGPKTRRKARVIRGRARHADYYTGCVRP